MTKEIILPKISGETLSSVYEGLTESKEGCWHRVLLVDNEYNKWCLVVGFGSGFDESPDFGNHRICTKIALNSSDLQCDYEYDFTMPYDHVSGIVWDTDSEVPLGIESSAEEWDELAEQLCEQAQKVVEKFACVG